MRKIDELANSFQFCSSRRTFLAKESGHLLIFLFQHYHTARTVSKTKKERDRRRKEAVDNLHEKSWASESLCTYCSYVYVPLRHLVN